MSAWPAVGALLIVASVASCAGDESGRSGRDPFKAIERDFERTRGDVRAAPRWERIAKWSGTGEAANVIDVSRDAIQWRARWTCRSGRFRLTVSPEPPGFVDAPETCPHREAAEFVTAGQHRLNVDASGPWRLTVDQQVETPLRERALAHGEVVSQGRFASVERPSKGTATVSRLPSGRLVLRLEDFQTSANSDLFVWLSRARDPRTTRQALAAPHRVLASLKATIGDQNYLLPRDLTTEDFRSIVIWCNPVRIAYAAAPLG